MNDTKAANYNSPININRRRYIIAKVLTAYISKSINTAPLYSHQKDTLDAALILKEDYSDELEIIEHGLKKLEER